MDLGSHETELSPMPISSSYHAPLHETAKLKLLTSGNGTPMEEVREIRPPEPPSVVRAEKPATVKKGTVRYRECHKNHAAGMGGHAIDGCGEFMPGGEEGTVDALKCAACDCHRNFHRREVEGEPVCDCKKDKRRLLPGGILSQGATLALPPSTQIVGRPTAPLMMALSSGAADSDDQDGGISGSPSAMKKRFRTKFSTEQKEKMCAFAEKLGWKIQKHDEAAVQEFCASIGVKRHVLKVWMHNNKHTLGKKI